MTGKQTFSVQLRPRQHEFLRRMAETYGLADESKALRVLIDFAVEAEDQQEKIFSEIRCLDC